MEISQWLQDLDQVTEAFRREFDHLSNEEINRRPSPATWSIAQNIQHLIRINESYVPVIAELRKGTLKLPWFAKWKFMVRFSGSMILRAVEPERRRKMKTFPVWEPVKSEVSGDIIEAFASHQENLKRLIRECAHMLDEGAVIYSPANRNVVYTLETAFDIIVTHEKRHLNQSREVFAIITKHQEASTPS